MKKLLESAGDDTALPRGAADSAARWLAQSAGLAPAEAVGILQKLPATCQKEAIRAWFQTTGASEPAAAWEALSKLPPEILDADTTEAVAKSVLFSEPEQWEKILSVLPEQTRQQAAPQIAAALMASGDSASAVAYAEKLFADPGGVSAKQAQPVLSALADGAASQPEDAAAFADFVETIQDPELRRIAQKEFVTQTYEHSSQALYEALVEQGTHGIEQSFLDTMLSDLPAGWKPPENIRLPWLSVPAATVHERPVFP